MGFFQNIGKALQPKPLTPLQIEQRARLKREAEMRQMQQIAFENKLKEQTEKARQKGYLKEKLRQAREQGREQAKIIHVDQKKAYNQQDAMKNLQNDIDKVLNIGY